MNGEGTWNKLMIFASLVLGFKFLTQITVEILFRTKSPEKFEDLQLLLIHSRGTMLYS